MCAFTALAADLPKLNESLGTATAKTDGDVLTVSTGAATRQWRWTGQGLLTESFASADGKVLATGAGKTADWDLGDLGAGKLVSFKAFENDDERFTTSHLAVEAEIEYPTLHLKYVIWAYPGAPGFRTQIWLKAPEAVSALGAGISEQLKLASAPSAVAAWGYEAGLKANIKDYEILRKDSLEDGGKIRLRNGLICSMDDVGLVLVKESHVHNQIRGGGVETGSFLRQGDRMIVDGLGLLATDVGADYKFCWGNWGLLYAGGELNAQLAIKQFDRLRFPVNPERDVFIMANTWGSEDKVQQCKYKAREENVLREIAACADLGVDLLQIDDGWQGSHWRPVASGGPAKSKRKQKDLTLLDGSDVPQLYDIYPNGFGPVREAAREAGIKLGLWHSWVAPAESLMANHDDGDFRAYKLDFAILKTKGKLDGLYYKARTLITHSDYSASVNWDVTEHPPRMGFYFGRDCGNLYLANRKAATVRSAVQYDPWQVLRDGWELADYMNLNKIQMTYQNKDLTPSDAKTDALRYPHGYNFAVTLMSSPILFTETQMISEQARDEIRPIIAAYKSERDAMYQGYVFAIGAKPDNGSWTGFQNHNPKTGRGYLTVFRELNNKETSTPIALHFMKPGATLELKDVLTGERTAVMLSDKSELVLTINEAPGFKFLKY